MMIMDTLADALNKIKLYENLGKYECSVSSTKLIKSVLEVLKNHKYIESFEEYKEGKFPALKIRMAKRINYLGVIKPRFAVGINDYQKYEARYIPSRDFGILIVSTPKGIMTNREASEKKIGGRLIAYVY
jgi:small subunit ribosomal protein S8